MTINLKVPDMKELKPRITVFGVGGAGGNAVNNMIQSGLTGVDFVVANTDAQALTMSSADRRVQMGTDLTEGLGAGSHPEVGRGAAEEVIDELRDQLSGAHMAFITAGMGGGTGTGAAPVIARVAREQGILTVGVVTKPFQFEGQRRQRTADAGIIEMQKYVDTLIVIPNQNLFRVANEKTTFADAFAMADQVLYSGVACITDLIVKEGLINLDFADVRSVMSEMGKAMMGTGEASGDKRAVEAAEAAISNPLLDDVSMRGARGLLISITGGNDLTLYEVDEAATRIREEVDPDANIILGATFDDSLEGVIRVSVVATGIDCEAGAVSPAAESTYSHAPVHIRSEEAAPAAPVAEWQGEADYAAEQPYEASEPAARTTEDGVTLKPLRFAPEPQAIDEPAESEIAAEIDEPYIPPAAEPVRPQTIRMPAVEEFPLPGRNQLRAASGQAPEAGLEAHRKKGGFFSRLAHAGFGMLDEGDSESAPSENTRRTEPALESSAPRMAARRSDMGGREYSGEQAVRTARVAGGPLDAGEDDQMEIPAFLRRQAN